jgi:hypothetical protein
MQSLQWLQIITGSPILLDPDSQSGICVRL